MKMYHLPIPEDNAEFFRTYAEIVWFEERLMNLLAIASNWGFYGKKR